MPDVPRPPLRLRRPKRDQVAPVPAYLDALLPGDHLARLLWAAVERLDLAASAAGLTVVEGGAGRAATRRTAADTTRHDHSPSRTIDSLSLRRPARRGTPA